MIGPAHTAESAVRIDHNDFRRGKALSLLKLPGKILRVNTDRKTGHVKSRHLYICKKIPAVYQTESVNFTEIFRSVRTKKSYKRILFRSGGRARKPLNPLETHLESSSFRIAFTSPRTGELQEIILHIKELNARTHCPLKEDAVVACMNKLCMAGNDRIISVESIVQIQIGIHQTVVQPDRKRLCLPVRFDISGRQTFEHRFSVAYLVRDVFEINDPAAVLLPDRAGRGFEISGPIYRVFLPCVMHGQLGRIRHADGCLGAPALFVEAVKVLAVMDGFSVIQVLELAVLHNANNVTDVGICQMKYFALLMKYHRHHSVSFPGYSIQGSFETLLSR